MIARSALALALIVLAACKSASPGPKGWRPVPGSGDAWSHAGTAGTQEYAYARESFNGSLHDLASQVTIDALLRNGGARLRNSVPFPACPGAAGVATFALRANRMLQEGFAVHDGQAITTTYIRPAKTPSDPNVIAAMQNVLC